MPYLERHELKELTDEIKWLKDSILSESKENEQLRQRVAELESDVEVWREKATDSQLHIDRLRMSLADTEALELGTGEKLAKMWKQLAASQLENKRLRSALEVIRDNTKENPTFLVCKEALREPTDTEALEKYVMERLGEPVAWDVYVPGVQHGYLVDSLNDEQLVDDMTNSNAQITPLYALKEPK